LDNADPVNFAWEALGEGVYRCRLPFLDVTIGLLCGRTGALLIDTGTTLTEATAVQSDVGQIAGRSVSHVLLTHNHFDHILGSSVFADAEVYCAPEVAATISQQTEHLHADAIRHGADRDEVERAVAALRVPDRVIDHAEIDLGGQTVAITHPGRGHTNHDLVAVVPGPAVVFCGDLIEESGDPAVDQDSDRAAWPATLRRVLDAGGPDAVYVPGHGAVVDAAFVERQRRWLQHQV
jgi:glyoxylase-like metal-dependent hydrolase (beta-lactamase superfamily II)